MLGSASHRPTARSTARCPPTQYEVVQLRYLATQPAPILTHLTIRAKRYEDFACAAPMFGSNAPCLHTVTLLKVTPYKDSVRMPTVQTLEYDTETPQSDIHIHRRTSESR